MSETSITQTTLESANNLEDLTDWERVKAMSESEIEVNALSDQDNQPLSPDNLKNLRRFNAPVGAVNSTLHDNAQAIAEYNEAPSQDLTESAAKIQDLLDQLSQTYPTETKKHQRTFARKAMEIIEDNAPLVQSIVKVIKAGQLQAIADQLNHPAKSSVVKQLEDLEEDA